MFAKGVKVISHIKNYKLLFLFKPSSVQSHPSSKKTNVLLELPYDEINECFINTDNQLINDISIGHKIYLCILFHHNNSASIGFRDLGHYHFVL